MGEKKNAREGGEDMKEMDLTLLIMAAGIGSRFGGGIKQLEPVDARGHIIMDYSIYDAMEAGFNKVVFVIIAIFKNKANSRRNGTSLSSQKAKLSEKHIVSRSEEHPGSVP